MVTKHGFLITMVISAAVGALVLAYSAPTQGAGAAGKGSSSKTIGESSNVDMGGSSKVDTGETGKTKNNHIRNVHHPDMAGEVPLKSTVLGGKRGNIELDVKGKNLNADAAIFGNQGVAGKIGTGKSNPSAGALTPMGHVEPSLAGKGKEGKVMHDETGGTISLSTTNTNKDGSKTKVYNITDAGGDTTGSFKITVPKDNGKDGKDPKKGSCEGDCPNDETVIYLSIQN